MSKIFVIAGNRAEANHWIKDNLEKRLQSGITTLSMSDYVYVDDVIRIRGIKDPHGVFVGSWKERVDIYEVVQTLIYCSIHVNKQLHDIHNSLKPKVKPTPKLRTISGGWINEELAVAHAATMLAKEIDEEVIKQVLGKINGGNVLTQG